MTADFIRRFHILFPGFTDAYPWQMTVNLEDILTHLMQDRHKDYHYADGNMIHKTAVIEQNVVLKAPVVIHANCFIGANAYLRGPVYLDENVKIGAGCEIKQSIIFSGTAIAHFNYIGNSIIGSNVNFEAGSVAANHFNERKDKTISVRYSSQVISTGVNKFGALVGDDSRIGANAVLSPGTLLLPSSIVKRLELVEQIPQEKTV